MIKIITAPEEEYSLAVQNSYKIFLAGGITNCPDWQSEIIELIHQKYATHELNFTLYNPRRPSFPMDKPEEAERQIVWEYQHLKEANEYIFWFSRGSLNPIVLYEYGKWVTSSNKPVIVGVDPDYERKEDVLVQTALARPEINIMSSLNEIVEQI
jgi:hypothetical protein